MTWWRGIALVLVAACGLLYAMGRRVPETHRAVAEGVVAASQDRVWSLVDDTATQTQWRTRLIKINPIQDSKDGRCWVEVHRTAILTLCQVEEMPKSKLVVRMLPTKAYSGTWTYTLRPVGSDATDITVTEKATIHSALWRFIGHYVMGENTNVKQFVQDLQAEALRKQ